MSYSLQHMQIMESLNQKLEDYRQTMEDLVMEREEFFDLLDGFPVLAVALDACAVEIFDELHKIQVRTSAIERAIAVLQKMPIVAV